MVPSLVEAGSFPHGLGFLHACIILMGGFLLRTFFSTLWEANAVEKEDGHRPVGETEASAVMARLLVGSE